MKLADMPAWRELLTGDDPYNRKKESLAGQLTARHIDELVALLEHGTDPEKESALSMFVTLRLALTSDSRFSDRTRATLRQIVLRHVQERYPLDPATRSTFVILRFLDPQAAARVLADLPISDEWSSQILTCVFLDMQMAGRLLVPRLQELSRLPGGIGERAMHALESQGHITPDELEQVGREFRTTHDIRALNRIFSSYILPRNGQAIAPILKLLGHPTVKLQGAYIYEADGIQLYMEEDREGRLTAAKMK